MPGVPSSRGCDGCRKQKKKCEVETPPCVRCQRLNLTCTGFGTKRYIFKDAGQRLALGTGTSSKPLADNPPSEVLVLPSPSTPPSNTLSLLRSSFISKIDSTIDIRVQLPWNFGPFVEEIPRRLGNNEALDAASDALVAVYTSYVAGNVQHSPAVLAKYGRALTVLREYLDDDVKARTSETLCSVMVLQIHQVFMACYRSGRHSEGAVQILKSRGYFGPKDDFETKLLVTLRGPVIVEALMSDKIHLTPQEWRDLVLNKLDGNTPDGHMMTCMAQLPHLMSRSREALKSPWDPENEGLRNEVQSLHERYQHTLTSLRSRWEDFNNPNTPTIPPIPIAYRKIYHAHYARSYGLGLAVGITLNTILVAMAEGPSPSGPSSLALRQSSSRLSAEVLLLAEQVQQHRPLATLYITVCLCAAYIAVPPEDEVSREKIMGLVADYQRDILGPTAPFSMEVFERIVGRFTLGRS